MPASRFLEYEVALLLAKYGRDALLRALSHKLHVTPEKLISILESPLNRKPSPSTRKKLSPFDVVEELVKKQPEKAQFLRALHGRFENRSFLPELRDVKRFFEQHQRSLGATKS